MDFKGSFQYVFLKLRLGQRWYHSTESYIWVFAPYLEEFSSQETFCVCWVVEAWVQSLFTA